jgi:flagellar capping protein FliD
VNVSIHPNDTNAQALSKVRSAINSSAAGVTASIADNEQAGTAALILLSKDSGANQGFILSDISGNMVAATGIGTISQEAADALYTLDGGAEQSSQSNELTLDDGKLSILLKQTDKEVMITVTPDEEAIAQDVLRLIGGYNLTVDAIRQAGSYVQGGLARRLQSAAAESLPQLELLGIIRRNGMLSLDENKLTSSTLTHFSAVERSLGSSSGIASKLGKAAGQLQELTPEALLDPHSSLFQEYANYSFVQQSLHTYLPVPLTGLLLNSYM